MIQDYGLHSPPRNPKEKRHSRSLCLPACFPSSTHPFDVLDDADCHVTTTTRAPRSPMMPEIKDRCRHLIAMIGGAERHGRGRRRAASADFSYDPSSYALNFEDDASRADDHQIFLNSGFSGRLPPSASGSLTPPENSTTSRKTLDDVLEEGDKDEDGEERRWRHSAPLRKAAAKGGWNAVSRIGRQGRNRHSSSSADFSYEPSSYALNFEDDTSPVKGFMARLPHSPKRLDSAESPQSLTTTTTPPSSSSAKCSTLRSEIAAFS